jgi:aspartate 1-decarboxylase
MQIFLLKSKLHRATVTGASLDYEGSLTISSDLAELVGLFEYEKILSVTLTTASGSRPT